MNGILKMLLNMFESRVRLEKVQLGSLISVLLSLPIPISLLIWCEVLLTMKILMISSVLWELFLCKRLPKDLILTTLTRTGVSAVQRHSLSVVNIFFSTKSDPFLSRNLVTFNMPKEKENLLPLPTICCMKRQIRKL